MSNYVEISSGKLNEGDFVCVTTYVDLYSNLKECIPFIFKYTNGILYNVNGVSLDEMAMKQGILPPYYVLKVDNKNKYVDLFFKNNVEKSIDKYENLTNKYFGSCRDILDRSIKAGDICVILKDGKFYHIDSNMCDDNIEYLIMYSKTKFLKVNSSGYDVITMSSSAWNSITYIKLSANKELKNKLQSYINIVLDETNKKKEKTNSFKEKFMLKQPGTLLSTGKADEVYVYLGNYKLNIDLCSYSNLSISPDYQNGGEMFVKILIDKNPGKTVYEKLISGTLTSSEFDTYLVKCGINLGLDYYYGYNTIDECIEAGEINRIEFPLNPKCIEVGLTYRKFRNIIGVYHIPSSLSFNLRGRRSYRDLIYIFTPC